jgi:hypothetical protein
MMQGLDMPEEDEAFIGLPNSGMHKFQVENSDRDDIRAYAHCQASADAQLRPGRANQQ